MSASSSSSISSVFSSPLPSLDETLALSLTLNLTLIPGLPNDLSALILSMIPYSCHARLKSTCKAWKLFLSSKTLISLRRNNYQSHLLCLFPQDPAIANPFLFDPKTLGWCPLPPLPINPHVYGLCNFTSISLGPNLYVLGGSHFDTRSFPLDRPTPSSSAFRFNFLTYSWELLSPMLSPRGSFACVALPNSEQILVAGGGSRHTMFRAGGSRMSSVERYDVEKDEWVSLDGLPRFRAGCAGFLIGNGEEREFWVMGGYGESRTISGVFPVDEYYKDGVIMEFKNGGKWRELGDMWERGERLRLGKIVVVDDDEHGGSPAVFMLDERESEIFRYDMTSNRWLKESSVPRKASQEISFGFIVLDRELYVIAQMIGIDLTETRRSRQHKRAATMFMQIYHPKNKTWRTLVTRSPFPYPIDFRTAVTSTICL